MMGTDKKSSPKPKEKTAGEGITPSPVTPVSKPQGPRENPKVSRGAMYTPAGCSLKYKKRWLLPGDKSDFADLSDGELSLLQSQGKLKKI